MYSATASTPDVTGFLPGQCLNDAALTYMLYRLWWTLTQIDASRAQRMAVFDTFAIKNFLGTAGNNGVLPDDYISKYANYNKGRDIAATCFKFNTWSKTYF